MRGINFMIEDSNSMMQNSNCMAQDSNPMIQVTNLSFSYTKQPFISGMSFSVSPGEIFGFLGPSGAGKSTLQKILIGLLANYQGSARVNGVECRERTKRFYEEIGVDFEFSTMYEKLTAKENLQFFASLYEKEPRPIEELFEMVGLEHDMDKRVSGYSKGMKSRLNFIKALLHDPLVLFLDEPTSGLDPANSRRMKDAILAEKAKGKTILLTTHNMQDATELCDRVAFIVGGKICALDSPRNLIMSKGAATVTYTWVENEGHSASPVNEGHSASPANEEHSASCPLGCISSDERLKSLIAENRLQSIHSSEPTLNDIFLDITGRALL